VPDRIYLPLNSAHYRRRDRLWAHWYAFCATLGGSGLGALIIVTTLVRRVSDSFPPDAPLKDPWDYPGWEK